MTVRAGSDAVAPWELTDDRLLAQCRCDSFTSHGPGGQRRNKTHAAVRFTHIPTGIHAQATNSRSQRENRIHALRELRHKLAMESCREVDPLTYSAPSFLSQYPSLRISPKNSDYPRAVAEVLDVLRAVHWEIPRAAVLLGHSTRSLLRFLHDDHELWELLGRRRADLGLGKVLFR